MVLHLYSGKFLQRSIAKLPPSGDFRRRGRPSGSFFLSLNLSERLALGTTLFPSCWKTPPSPPPSPLLCSHFLSLLPRLSRTHAPQLLQTALFTSRVSVFWHTHNTPRSKLLIRLEYVCTANTHTHTRGVFPFFLHSDTFAHTHINFPNETAFSLFANNDAVIVHVLMSTYMSTPWTKKKQQNVALFIGSRAIF